MCKYCFVACHIYVTLALRGFLNQLFSHSALSSGLLLKVHGFQLVQKDEFYRLFFFYLHAHHLIL